MKLIRINEKSDVNLLAQKSEFKNGSVIALGFFDGVHLAHRELLSKAKDEALNQNLPLLIFTFSADGSEIKSDSKRLITDEEKILLLKECGADCVLLAKFSLFMNMTAEAFAREFLAKSLHARSVVIGFNYKFGKGGRGDAVVLKSIMHECGADTIIIPPYTYRGEEVSSSRIRTLIAKKQFGEATRLLGKPYFIEGCVSHGLGLGKKLGFPTVNVSLPTDRVSPPVGVYATAIRIGEKTFAALTNVGSCPTFDERAVHTESFILNYSGDLYGQKIKICFVEFLRDEKKFLSPEELISQINVDKMQVLRMVNDSKWQEIGLNLQ